MPPIASLLSTSPTAAGDVFSEVLPWLVVLVILVLVGGIVISAIRKSIRSDEGDAAHGFTLHDLRRMHAAGDLSDEQFERAKAKLIRAVRSSTSENTPPPERAEPQENGDSNA